MAHVTHRYTWLVVGGQTPRPAYILFSKGRPLRRHLNVEATSNFSKNSKHSYFFVHLYLTGASNKVCGPKPVHNHTLRALPWKRTNLLPGGGAAPRLRRGGGGNLEGWVSSVQFSRSVVSDSLRPHELQHARPPCPSPNPGVHSNSCASSRWCHPTISSSVVPFSSCIQSFPTSGSFPMSQFFASGGQSIGVSASASVLPMSIQGWFPLGLTGLISLQAKGLSRVFSNTMVQKHQFSGTQLSL